MNYNQREIKRLYDTIRENYMIKEKLRDYTTLLEKRAKMTNKCK